MRAILESHPVANLKAEMKKFKSSLNYGKLKKAELINLMMKHQDQFKHLKMYVKPERKKPIKKEVKKSVNSDSSKVLEFTKNLQKKLNINVNDKKKKETKKPVKKEVKKPAPKKKETPIKKLEKLTEKYDEKVEMLTLDILSINDLKSKFKKGKDAFNYLKSIGEKFNKIQIDLGRKINSIGQDGLVSAQEFNDITLNKRLAENKFTSTIRRRMTSLRSAYTE